ncbi:MAG: hypothetical protein ABIH90_03305 [Candidatus Aenigmatarchaeota archaeon]
MLAGNKPRLRVGFFSFTCDEGCMITFLEVLNTKLFDWKDKIDMVYCRQLQKKGEIRKLDVAFVEGAISSIKDRKRLVEVRANTDVLVAMGSCAISGAPSNQRNFFDDAKKEEIGFLLHKFQQLPKVLSVKDVVTAEYVVPGCPMDETKFIAVMEEILKGGKHA